MDANARQLERRLQSNPAIRIRQPERQGAQPLVRRLNVSAEPMRDLSRASSKEFPGDRTIAFRADENHSVPSLPDLIEQPDKVIDFAVNARSSRRLAALGLDLRPAVDAPNLVACASLAVPPR